MLHLLDVANPTTTSELDYSIASGDGNLKQASQLLRRLWAQAAMVRGRLLKLLLTVAFLLLHRDAGEPELRSSGLVVNCDVTSFAGVVPGEAINTASVRHEARGRCQRLKGPLQTAALHLRSHSILVTENHL
jgi:hypothetical protein